MEVLYKHGHDTLTKSFDGDKKLPTYVKVVGTTVKYGLQIWSVPPGFHACALRTRLYAWKPTAYYYTVSHWGLLINPLTI